ncbi:MAG: flippase [Clostridia bacterium]|nr:flippase [Clostridia bacterium]
MNRILRNYVLDVAYEIVALLVPLVTAPYLTRVLHAENYGIYSYVQSVGGMIITLSLLGIYSYGNRQIAYCRDNADDLSQTFWELMFLRLLLGALGTCVYFVFGMNTKYSWYFSLYYAYYLANILDCSWVYVGMENMLPCVIKNMIAKVVTLVGVFLLVKTENDVWKYTLLVSAGALVVNLSVYIQLKGIVKKPVVKLGNVFYHLKGSAYLFMPQIASLLYLQMDKAMLEWLTGGTAQVSFYDQAEKIVTIPLAIITALSTVMMPRIANNYRKGNQDQIRYYLGKGMQYSLFLALPLAVGIASIATELIPWYLGADYMPTAYAMVIISPIVISNSLLGITGKQYFTATNKIGILALSNTIAAAINLVANWILIPTRGYAGAAIATLLASCINVVIQLWYMNRTISVGSMLRASYKSTIGAIVMGISIIATTRLFQFPAAPSTTIAQTSIGLIVYAAILMILKDKSMNEMLSFILKRKTR